MNSSKTTFIARATYFSCIVFSFLFTACHGIKQPGQPDNVAYGTIRFGMKAETYLPLYKDTVLVIENSLFKLNPFFIPSSHRLYMLRLESDTYEGKGYNQRLQQDVKTLTSQFIDLYGNPTLYHHQFKQDELEEGKVGWLSEWIFKNKLIHIGIAHIHPPDKTYDYGPQYKAVCEIISKPLQAIANEQLISPFPF